MCMSVGIGIGRRNAYKYYTNRKRKCYTIVVRTHIYSTIIEKHLRIVNEILNTLKKIIGKIKMK